MSGLVNADEVLFQARQRVVGAATRLLLIVGALAALLASPWLTGEPYDPVGYVLIGVAAALSLEFAADAGEAWLDLRALRACPVCVADEVTVHGAEERQRVCRLARRAGLNHGPHLAALYPEWIEGSDQR